MLWKDIDVNWNFNISHAKNERIPKTKSLSIILTFISGLY